MAKIGFIGTGVIASSIVTGFCAAGGEHEIVVSPRNAERAAALAEKFPTVYVAASNQEVIDRSEWVVLSVVPSIGAKLLSGLSFNPAHKVVNLMAMLRLPDIEKIIGKTKALIHMVPLPFIAQRTGPIVMYPRNDELSGIFSPLGSVYFTESEKEAEALQVITALMSHHYRMLSEVAAWGEKQGLNPLLSAEYTAEFFGAIANRAFLEASDLHKLAQEYTPGGLNEAALKRLEESGMYSVIGTTLDMVAKRTQDGKRRFANAD